MIFGSSQFRMGSHGLKTRVTGAAVCILLMTPILRADPGPTTRPLLDELNRQTVAVYRQVGAGIYRVRLPEPKWVKAYAMAAMTRWDKSLDPELRKRLQEEPPVPVEAEIVSPPAAHPNSAPSIIVRPRQQSETGVDPLTGGELRLPASPEGWAQSNIGLLIDPDGHLLVPLYVEPELIHGKPLDVIGPDGKWTTATFVGSDRPTNLTLLQLNKPASTPVALGANRPESGSLVLQLSCADGSGRLGLWTDQQRETGVIVSIDGQVSGISRAGQFLSGSACRLIARQLIQYGLVKRATLGVLITEVPQEGQTGHTPIGSRWAMRIDQVMTGAAADRAGLRPGDLVLAIAGAPVGDLPTFAAEIAARDGMTALHIRRGTQEMNVLVNLEQQK